MGKVIKILLAAFLATSAAGALTHTMVDRRDWQSAGDRHATIEDEPEALPSLGYWTDRLFDAF